ncbi:DUF551 domain-containing protein [Halomonas sp. DP8Y7-1]|uniref:DUF551 domain-containing protein n=1 Tax=Halomonas sp. DP8Y7-1 TaxID=2859078 RepID=UPI001C98460C|nr:DUF551 domain-containing protein [Halomonas sp. DP8Y7-1]MBY6030016.1 DUF551 domain-containing protein [Halomonas sp. DP8Y7-1]
MSEWISVKDRLPEAEKLVVVYTPPQSGDCPEDIRMEFDCIDQDSGLWFGHSEHYEHYCCVAKGGCDISWSGPSEEAPYTHWMPLPAPPEE